MTDRTTHLKNLIVVACHAPFKETTLTVPERPEDDDAWVLQSFQLGEPPLYVAHARRGVELLRADPEALLIFSGGYTRREAGLRWSEAKTYWSIAKVSNWWNSCKDEHESADFESRTALEDYSRDSFENLLFSLCRFQQVVGEYPQHVTLISWAFKQERFDLHREAIHFPASRFRFDGFNEPIGLQAALRGEAVTLAAFRENRYGSNGTIADKRSARNPFNRRHDFQSCPGMKEFFQFLEECPNAHGEYRSSLPWEGTTKLGEKTTA
jgi:hypothetical protein